jgi:hypothetical protein
VLLKDTNTKGNKMAELGKRQMERFNISVPAVVSLKNIKDSPPSAIMELKTRNVCAGGAFMLTDTPVELGTEVEVNLHLTFFTGSLENERKSKIHVSGSVIRVEDGGMAVQFDDKYRISPVLEDAMM